MSTKIKHGLGRGLDALLANPDVPENTMEIDINRIDPNPKQPRRQFDEEKLAELSASIREHGVLQPLLLVQRGERYMLVAGERRWRASRMAGLKQVPALVRDYTDQQIAEISLVENLQRDDLNPLDEAQGIRSLLETFQLTQEQVADRLSMSRSAVTNSLRLLALPENIRSFLREGVLSAGHARALAGLESGELQTSIARRAIDGGLSVREVEHLTRQAKTSKNSPPASEPPRHIPEFQELEDRLMRVFGTKARVKGTLERGSIVLDYYNRQDLERFYELVFHLYDEKEGKQKHGA